MPSLLAFITRLAVARIYDVLSWTDRRGRTIRKVALCSLVASLLMPLGAETYSDKNVVATYPTTVSSTPGKAATFMVGVEGVQGSPDNVSGLTCAGTGLNVTVAPQFNPLQIGVVNNYMVNIDSSASGTFPINCTLLTGITGGADDSPIALKTIQDVQQAPAATLPTFTSVPFTGYFNDPVSTATGELYDPNIPPDLSLGGPLPVEFRRYYASLINANGFVTRIGNNWMHNYEYRVGISGSTATVTFFGGKAVVFNASGNSWQLANPDLFGYQLANGPGANHQFLDPATNRIYTFDSAGSLIKIEDRNGNALNNQLPVNGTAQVSDGLGRSITLTYSADGKLVKVADQTGRAVSFAYNGNDLSQVTDANGKVETYAYTTAGSMVGLMTSSTLPLGNKPFTQVWDTSGKVTQQSDSRSDTTTYAYDPAGVAPTSITDPLGSLQQQVHANYKTETSYTDANGNTISMGYDTNGHRTSVTDRMGDTTTVTYHNPSGYLASVTDALGNTTTYTYAAQVQGPFIFYVLTEIQNADGTNVSMAYDNLGNVTSLTDASGKVTKFTYNGHGQVLTATNPAGGVTTYTYNADATVATETDPSGNTSIFSYDNQKRPAQIKHADGSTVAFTWDNRDNLLKVTDERGKVVATAYNDNNRIKSVTDPLGASATLQYDTDERLSTLVDRAGKTTSLSYNELGSPKLRKNPAGEQTTFGYDKLNRLTTVLDGAGNALTFTYDKEDVLSSASDALGRAVTFTSDKLGRTKRLTTPLGENYDTAYDSLGRLTSETDALSRTIKYGYDPRGLLTSSSLPLGISASYTRTELGLIGSITDPNGNVWSQTFDAAGRLTSSTDPLGRAISATYENRNRLSGAKSPEGTVAFTYDPAGNLVRELHSDGTDLGFTFDDNNRLVSAPGIKFQYDANDRLISSNGVVIVRDDDGRIASVTYTNGQTVKYHYNAIGLLDTIMDWVGGSTTFSYDSAHQLVSIKRPNGTSTQYTYDQDGRLSAIIESAGAKIALQRDAAGQITSADRTLPQSPAPVAGTLPLAYDAADQISGATYDGLGRLKKDAMRSYTWDLATRLTSYNGADGSATAAYDALGMRISSTTGGTTNKYVLNYALGLPSIDTLQDGSGKDVRYYVHTPGGALLYSIEAAGNQRHFFHFDEMGSTTFLTADDGSVTDSYGITSYGEAVTTGAKNATNNPFTWLGMLGVMQESSTGLYYMRARWYDSASARFLSKDPVPSLSPRAINPYQYALANPHSFVDPTGLDGESLNFSGYYTGMNPATCPAGNSTMGSAALSTRILLRFSNVGLGVRLVLPGVVPLTLGCGENTTHLFTPGNPAGLAAAPVHGAWTGGYLVLLGTSDLQENPGAFTTSLSPNLGNRFAPYKLFPFGTQASGFDTGIAIANTTTDPFGTAPQTGPVDLFFYGQVTGGGVPKTSPSRPNGPPPPARNPYEHFVVGDYVFNPAVYNEFGRRGCTKGRTVADAAAVLSALVGVDPRDPSTGDYFSGCLVR